MEYVFAGRGITADDITDTIPYDHYDLQIVAVYGNEHDEFPILKIKATYESGRIAYHLAGIKLIDGKHLTFNFLDIHTEDNLNQYLQQMKDVCTVGKSPKNIEYPRNDKGYCDLKQEVDDFLNVFDIQPPDGMWECDAPTLFYVMDLYKFVEWIEKRVDYKVFCEKYLTKSIERVSINDIIESLYTNYFPSENDDNVYGSIEKVWVEWFAENNISLPFFISNMIHRDSSFRTTMIIGPTIKNGVLSYDYVRATITYEWWRYLENLDQKLRDMPKIDKVANDFGLAKNAEKYNVVYNAKAVNKILKNIKL